MRTEFQIICVRSILKDWRKLFSFALLSILIYGGCQRKNEEARTHQPNPPSLTIPSFDGKKAFEHLRAQTSFGPRVANTEAHRQCLNYLESELRKYADTLYLQPFTHTGYDNTTLYLTNIIASFQLQARSRILLCAHWDSRPWADQDPNIKNRKKPVPGANDGASGVAVILEIARHLKNQAPSVGVDIVLFDGEDYGRSGDLENFLLGSKYFVRNKPRTFNPDFGILLDMVGDAQLELPKEANSMNYAPEIVNNVWSIAKEIGSLSFIDSPGEAVYDDHVPLNEVGIKTINIIDFQYPDESHRYWHTLNDTPDKCSSESLEEVGRVLIYLIYRRPL